MRDLSILSNEIINNHQIRNSIQEKGRFIELIKSEIKDMPVEVQDFAKGKGRNIIIGNLENADVILTAHYDTPKEMLIPRIVFGNGLFFVIYLLLILALMFCIMVPFAFMYAVLLLKIGFSGIAGEAIFKIGLITIVILLSNCVLIGIKKNKNNFNDNTSGVVTLIELYNANKENKKVAYVLFDNEEKGLKGAKAFRKEYKDMLNTKHILNFDCVGDGENIILIPGNEVDKEIIESLKNYFAQINVNIAINKKYRFFFMSDYCAFTKGIGFQTVKKKKVIGYYLDRIHTKRDTILNKNNIWVIVSAVSDYVKNKNI